MRSPVKNPQVTAAGFTLVELVTTLVLVGILTAIAAPQFFDNQAFTQRGYTDELADTLRYAQRIAVASQCNVRVVINAANYSAAQRNTCTAGGWTRTLRRSDGSQASGTAPNSVAVTPATTVVFDRSGHFVGATLPVLSVGSFTISADPQTALITVQP